LGFLFLIMMVMTILELFSAPKKDEL